MNRDRPLRTPPGTQDKVGSLLEEQGRLAKKLREDLSDTRRPDQSDADIARKESLSASQITLWYRRFEVLKTLEKLDLEIQRELFGE